MTGNGIGRNAAKDLVIIGSGGFARETAEAVQALNEAGARWRLLGYLDEDPAKRGTRVDGVPVLGGLGEIQRFPDASVVVCTGRPDNYVSRPRIVGELGLPEERYATIVHPTATVSASSSIGPGSVVLAQVVLTAAVQVGSHVAIMPHVTLTHDNVIADFATLASAVCLGGGVRVGRAAYIGAGALVREGCTVGDVALVAMGGAVTRDIPARQVWAGVPARYLRDVAVQHELAPEEGH